MAYYGKLVKGRRNSVLVQRGPPIILRLYATAAASLRSGKPRNNAWNRGVLHARDPRCHWCGIITIIAPPETRALSHFHATVDHVFGVKSDRRDEIVLACHGCNTRRGELMAPRRHIDPERRANTLALVRQLTAAPAAPSISALHPLDNPPDRKGDLHDEADHHLPPERLRNVQVRNA